MTKANCLLIKAVAALIAVGASSVYSEEPATESSGTLCQVPLIVGKVFLPDSTEEGARGKPTERLDMEIKYEPGDDVLACLLGAKTAGWTAGYEFLPAHDLKKGEKPRDIVPTLKSDSDVFVLLRVSTRTPDFGSGPIISVMADAALYRKDTMESIESAGFLNLQKADPKQVNGSKVNGEYWTQTVASLFASEFDKEFLSKMQSALDGKKIREEVSDLKESASGTIAPSITVLQGSDERPPKLKIDTNKAGLTAEAYLVSGDEKVFRKWFVGSAGNIDADMEPGDYALYVRIKQEGSTSSQTKAQCTFKAENKKQYMFTIE